MDQKQLGKSDLHISRLSFGCMSLKGDEADDVKLLQEALEKGINFFDTADLYDKGANEALVGKAYKNFRKKLILATKVGNQWRPDGSGWDWNPRKAYIVKAVEESLRRLCTDYIDLYQLHGGTIEDPIDETIEAFELLQQQGKIRYYGISSIRPNVIRRWVEKANITSVMLQYSLLDRRPEEAVLPLLAGNNIGVLSRGALAQGLLLGKTPKPYLEHDVALVEKAAKAIRNNTHAQQTETGLALHWTLQNSAVTSAVAGIRNRDQLEQAVSTMHQLPLSPGQYQALSDVVPAHHYQQHR